jgi:hypothetical protein
MNRAIVHHEENEFPLNVEIQADRPTYERDRRWSAPPRAAITIRNQSIAVAGKYVEDFGKDPYGQRDRDHRVSVRVIAQTLKVAEYNPENHFYAVNPDFGMPVDWMDTFLAEHDPLLIVLREGKRTDWGVLREIALGNISP